MMLRQEHIIYAVDCFVFQLDIIRGISSFVMVKPQGLYNIMDKVGAGAHKNIDLPVPDHIAYDLSHPCGDHCTSKSEEFCAFSVVLRPCAPLNTRTARSIISASISSAWAAAVAHTTAVL